MTTSRQLYRAGQKVFEKFPVPAERKSWSIEWPDYQPTPVNIDFGTDKPWADPDLRDEGFRPKWNEIDGKVDRRSHHGPYQIDRHEFPCNPSGRTGVSMRGMLGRWGPNHAADPIVTRWKRIGETIQHDPVSGKPILQFVAIQRCDVLQWAIPGGMVDPGETVPETLKREFFEESLNSLQMSRQQRERMDAKLRAFFSQDHGDLIYKGIVQDPRNTDNAWIETVAVNFHDQHGSILNDIHLEAGDDARRVRWMDIDRSIKLYASHLDLIKSIVEKRQAHW